MGDLNSYAMEQTIDGDQGRLGRHRRHGRRLHQPDRALPGRVRLLVHLRRAGRLPRPRARQRQPVRPGRPAPRTGTSTPTSRTSSTTTRRSSRPAQEALYEPNAYRTSDHDPVVVGLNPNAAPTVDAGGPYSVFAGFTVGVTATGSDPNGDTLTYAWDLDDNGSFETPGQSATFSAVVRHGSRSPHDPRAGDRPRRALGGRLGDRHDHRHLRQPLCADERTSSRRRASRRISARSWNRREKAEAKGKTRTTTRSSRTTARSSTSEIGQVGQRGRRGAAEVALALPLGSRHVGGRHAPVPHDAL